MDWLTHTAKDWLTLALAGLGVTFLPHEFIGGMFLALAGAAVAMRLDPEQDRRELWLVMLGAFICAYLAIEALQFAVAHGWLAPVPPQPVMLAAGFFSRLIMRQLLRIGGLIDRRADTIVDAALDRVLPDDKDKPEDGR